jgi:hypothetical protein
MIFSSFRQASFWETGPFRRLNRRGSNQRGADELLGGFDIFKETKIRFF